MVTFHQIPVLFGGDRRLFELLPSRIELDVRVSDPSRSAGHEHIYSGAIAHRDVCVRKGVLIARPTETATPAPRS